MKNESVNLTNEMIYTEQASAEFQPTSYVQSNMNTTAQGLVSNNLSGYVNTTVVESSLQQIQAPDNTFGPIQDSVLPSNEMSMNFEV